MKKKGITIAAIDRCVDAHAGEVLRAGVTDAASHTDFAQISIIMHSRNGISSAFRKSLD